MNMFLSRGATVILHPPIFFGKEIVGLACKCSETKFPPRFEEFLYFKTSPFLFLKISVYFLSLERWPSGLRQRFTKPPFLYWNREFESHSLRNFKQSVQTVAMFS